MKKLFLMIVGIFLSVGLFASESTETIYLKNGSVINGMVVEEIPGVSVKVQTSDGSIFLYQIDEVEKITKRGAKSDINLLEPTEIKTGYRGSVDFGYSFGVGTWRCDRFEILTTHGYQFNPYFYAGVGTGLNVWFFEDSGMDTGFPLYAKFRCNVLDHKLSPFIDVNIGYSVGNISGLYFAPSLGVRFTPLSKVGINLHVGYTLQRTDALIFFMNGQYMYDNINLGAITLRCGIDF